MTKAVISKERSGALGGTSLEKLLKGLDEGELQVLGQPPHVVVALDGVAVLLPAAGRRARLYHVRVQCALRFDRRYMIFPRVTLPGLGGVGWGGGAGWGEGGGSLVPIQLR